MGRAWHEVKRIRDNPQRDFPCSAGYIKLFEEQSCMAMLEDKGKNGKDCLEGDPVAKMPNAH